MYSYTFDTQTGGIILNSTPTNFSKEPRPVYAKEMDILGFRKFWEYEDQNDIPYMWAESNVYWYRGTQIAKTKGGDLYTAPVLEPVRNEEGIIPYSKDSGEVLQQIDITAMCELNEDLLTVIEDSTVKKIVKEYEKFNKKLDIFHVAFSGGKDSAVLLHLIKKVLPVESFVVIFSDTGMEFPDTYKAVEITKKQCEEDGTPFYVARSHFEPEDSWKMFGPPARVLRWCCSVHKSTPQTLKMREITGKDNYVGMDFVGVRAHESLARSKYDYENFGKKQKGQYSFNPILEWTSAEVWLYMFRNNIYINEAYKKGNSRAGCLFCPMGGGKGDFFQYRCYPDEIDVYINLIKSMNARNAGDESALNSYITNGGWNARKNGRDLTINQIHYSEIQKGDNYVITVSEPKSDWHEWIKTLDTIPFEYSMEETEDGYIITYDKAIPKKYPQFIKKFRQVFKKAAYCVGCKVCETNCRNGCISFVNGKVRINDCSHCGQCHDIDDGCVAYHSLRVSTGDGKMRKESINSFANHAPKLEWVQDFFDMGNDYWTSENGLNKDHQVPMFKKFLRSCGFIDEKGATTDLYDISNKHGVRSCITWGLALSNLAYNPECRWYINNMDTGVYYERAHISDMLIADGVKKGDATSIINAFKRFCALPLGTSFNFGFV
ncbi:MAG: phosphoadenosine phosphosulfate reductase family protein, partial [Oscillospiraceae bacterium]|nr:phosphoadenosine phosphosulfate reductase family protein [Oscillospiraceae bacterium]